MSRQNISTGSKWEPLIGYSRAVKIGNRIVVSGTTATDSNGEIVGKDDAYTQTKQALNNILAALEKAGATAKDVVRSRIFTTDISRWEEIGKAHGEVFGEIRPALTMVEVTKLIDPLMLVEIEVEAVIEE